MTRTLPAAAALAALLSASAAVAADMPASYPRTVYAPPPAASCGYDGRRSDHVWEAPQTAYIVAGSCNGGYSLSAWLNKFHISPRVPLRVYYNGGSMWRTDINTIDVPPQPQLR